MTLLTCARLSPRASSSRRISIRTPSSIPFVPLPTTSTTLAVVISSLAWKSATAAPSSLLKASTRSASTIFSSGLLACATASSLCTTRLWSLSFSRASISSSFGCPEDMDVPTRPRRTYCLTSRASFTTFARSAARLSHRRRKKGGFFMRQRTSPSMTAPICWPKWTISTWASCESISSKSEAVCTNRPWTAVWLKSPMTCSCFPVRLRGEGRVTSAFSCSPRGRSGTSDTLALRSSSFPIPRERAWWRGCLPARFSDN